MAVEVLASITWLLVVSRISISRGKTTIQRFEMVVVAGRVQLRGDKEGVVDEKNRVRVAPLCSQWRPVSQHSLLF